MSKRKINSGYQPKNSNLGDIPPKATTNVQYPPIPEHIRQIFIENIKEHITENEISVGIYFYYRKAFKHEIAKKIINERFNERFNRNVRFIVGSEEYKGLLNAIKEEKEKENEQNR